MATFGEELKRLAESKGFTTQQQLADASGISQSMIAALFLDQRPNVSAAILFKLCDVIGASADHFRPLLSFDEIESHRGRPKNSTPLPKSTKTTKKPAAKKAKKS